MPDTRKAIVTNTTPLIALAVAIGNLEILRLLYSRVVVPFEVAEELHGGGIGASCFDTPGHQSHAGTWNLAER